MYQQFSVCGSDAEVRFRTLVQTWTFQTGLLVWSDIWHALRTECVITFGVRLMPESSKPVQIRLDVFELFLHLHMIHSMSSGLLPSIYPNIFSDCLATNSIWPLSVLGTLNDQEWLFRTKTLNACLLAMSDFISNLLNVLVSSLSIIIQIII